MINVGQRCISFYQRKIYKYYKDTNCGLSDNDVRAIIEDDNKHNEGIKYKQWLTTTLHLNLY